VKAGEVIPAAEDRRPVPALNADRVQGDAHAVVDQRESQALITAVE
jgi:hypothetical protein